MTYRAGSRAYSNLYDGKARHRRERNFDAVEGRITKRGRKEKQEGRGRRMDSHLRLPLRITLEKYKRWHVCVREFKKIGSFPVPFPPLSAPSFSLSPLVPSSPLPMVNPRNYHRTLHLWKYPQIDVLLSFSFSFSLFFFIIERRTLSTGTFYSQEPSK